MQERDAGSPVTYFLLNDKRTVSSEGRFRFTRKLMLGAQTSR